MSKSTERAVEPSAAPLVPSVVEDQDLVPVEEPTTSDEGGESHRGRLMLHTAGSALVAIEYEKSRRTRYGEKYTEPEIAFLEFQPLNSTGDGPQGFPPIADGSFCRIDESTARRFELSLEELYEAIMRHENYGFKFAFYDDEEGRRRIVAQMIDRAKREEKVMMEAYGYAIPRSDLALPSHRQLW